ncbi:MAG TPA: Xaa-Pro peptidase family protein [Kiritimatiellia bacterium]|nr:Xaa-Pro peptidase family protein [Kiritimatiellia bacterium]HMO99575.1 Xaa-Pro peptidase family protein [Kiritimatiellia bacterium]HMP97550.1 Xaa-Pro peptidase family protein [Kiritimatiellia bacterium]
MAKQLTLPRLLVEGADSGANLVYGSGFHPVDPVVFLDESTRRTLVVPMLEYRRAREEANNAEVFLPEDLGIPKKKMRSLSAWALYLLRRRGVRRVRVGGFFPAGIARDLERAGVRVLIEPASLYPERAIKTNAEIAAITKSQQAAVAGMRAAHRVLKEAEIGRGGWLRWQGRTLTSERLRDVIDGALLQHGCIARDTIVAGDAQAADPHERGHGPLRAGTSIVLDIFPRHKRTGYWGDITRTFCKGPPSPALARMYRTVLTAHRQALAMIRPGLPGNRVHEAVSDFFVKEGYPTVVQDGVVRGFFHGTGHGVGLDIHEAPSISRAETQLLAGHVVTVEPGLYDPDIGGVRIEDTVVIEKRGARILASFPNLFRV